MKRAGPTTRTGITIAELMIGMVAAIVAVLAIGFILADSQRGWSKMYERTYSDVAVAGYVARARFDTVARKAGASSFSIAADGSWVELGYYSDPNSASADRYGRFYTSSNDLKIEYGQLNPRQTIDTETICGNVSSCVFKRLGRSVQMILTLDDGTYSTDVMTSAVMHNQ